VHPSGDGPCASQQFEPQDRQGSDSLDTVAGGTGPPTRAGPRRDTGADTGNASGERSPGPPASKRSMPATSCASRSLTTSKRSTTGNGTRQDSETSPQTNTNRESQQHEERNQLSTKPRQLHPTPGASELTEPFADDGR